MQVHYFSSFDLIQQCEPRLWQHQTFIEVPIIELLANSSYKGIKKSTTIVYQIASEYGRIPPNWMILANEVQNLYFIGQAKQDIGEF